MIEDRDHATLRPGHLRTGISTGTRTQARMSRLYVIGTSIYIKISIIIIQQCQRCEVSHRTRFSDFQRPKRFPNILRRKKRSNTATKNRSSRHCTVATSCCPQLQVLPYILRAFALSKHWGAGPPRIRSRWWDKSLPCKRSITQYARPLVNPGKWIIF